MTFIPTTGVMLLVAALTACGMAVVCLAAGIFRRHRCTETKRILCLRQGCFAAALAAGFLTASCVLLVACFVAGDSSLDYVVRSQSHVEGNLAWLFDVSGLWAGRSGSLLTWTWLISLFSAALVGIVRKLHNEVDAAALFVSQCVLLTFISMVLFVDGNMPFAAISPMLLDADGTLTQEALMFGRSQVLEHWAMALHPFAVFVSYAGFVIPFSYAIAALIVCDSSAYWVKRTRRITFVSWLFLTAGIVVGALWAYETSGWGGYWNWDAVETASLLPWLSGLALIHALASYRKRRIFKRWAVFFACLTLFFAVFGTFITRSGLIASVHSYAGGSVSVWLFLVLASMFLLVGVVGLVVRRRSFGAQDAALPDIASLLSLEAANYINMLLLLCASLLLLYMLLASALPQPFPYAGYRFLPYEYNVVMLPLGVIYGLLAVVVHGYKVYVRIKTHN